jgi:hypothetical protein
VPLQAPSFTRNPHNGDVYSAYNKPEAVIDWLAHNDIEEEFVLILDADMIMRAPFIPEDLGAREGTAISAYYGYLKVHKLTMSKSSAQLTFVVSSGAALTRFLAHASSSFCCKSSNGTVQPCAASGVSPLVAVAL